MDGQNGARALTLRAALKRHGMTLQDAAEKIDVHPISITRLMRGDREFSHALWVGELARLADVSADFLLGLTDDPTPYWNRPKEWRYAGVAPISSRDRANAFLEDARRQAQRHDELLDSIRAS